MALSTGSLLSGRYEITAPIAVGGMGEVWKARDRVLDRIVAAKVLKSEFTNDPSFLARFRNEARHTAALSHPNIASVYDYGETLDDTGTQQLAFLVMEYVEGQPLVTILHDEGKLPVDWTLHVLEQSADGLSAAHRAGVVHRDIKPGNLMVRPDGVVKLTDFGIAQARDATPLTRTGMVVGTAQYLSPEQAQGMEVNAASDVYSLGVVAYECLTGARPFDGASQVAIALAHINRPPPPLPAHVPPAVRLLVERALAKDPADRFPDGGAFAEAIRRVASGGTLAPVVGPGTMPTQIVAADALENSRTQVIAVTDATAVAGVGPVGPRTGPGAPMPPLHAADDDEEWTPEEEPDDRRRGGRAKWAWLAAALALVLLLGGGAWWLLGSGDRGRDDQAGASPTPSVSSTAPTGLFLDPDRFIGEPADDVEAQLTAAGLTVTQVPADDDVLADVAENLEAGDVAGLEPANEQAAPGDAVTLYVAEEAYSPEQDEEEAPAPVTSEAPAEEPTQAPAPTPTTPTTPTTATTATTSSSPPPAPGQPGGPGPEDPPPPCEVDCEEVPDGGTGDTNAGAADQDVAG
jgi:eukaryotic-like serine/threonine-protein kinase